MNFIFRKGTIADKEKLQALGILSYSQHQQAMTSENWDKYNSFISNPETFTYLLSTSTCFVCEYNAEIIGMAFLVSNGYPTEMFEDTWSYIRMVGVNPSFGGKGIAKKLTQMCINYAKETNEDFIALHTSEFMNAARHIYENFGFKVVRELRRYDKKYWIYLLELNT
ncbi:GNAT family N-acetyltransferase [Kordia zhangzhouensis]|uniref:GNAT family N-acetyltransferase n=1 Tax=Kordia zhangzhouensis TaxID=1620405 RepID=UPI000629C449|nr:GNAT family N-acetyltransferase [Kordia zhangzhouensis]